jgi:hypothetical protein
MVITIPSKVNRRLGLLKVTIIEICYQYKEDEGVWDGFFDIPILPSLKWLVIKLHHQTIIQPTVAVML